MDELTAERFPEFFEAVRGHEPFPWQADLARTLLHDPWPDVIDVPTGLGKTSVMDCWVYALAASAATHGHFPRRLFFVVDRRLVVDGAFEEAKALAKALRGIRAPSASGPQESEIVAQVAGALRGLHGDKGEPPLQVVRMRGGVSWESRWLARPDQPGLVVGTVDQFGSRLLFRGYGVTELMRPVDAALVALDSWLVVDEAHIAGPLVATAGRVAAYQGRFAPLEAGRGLRITRMSATSTGAGRTFRPELDAQTLSTRFPQAAVEAARRLDVNKPASLVDLTYLTGTTRRGWRKKSRWLGQALAALARELDPEPGIVGVVTNTVSTARAAHRHLTDAGEEAVLLVGRVRGHERDEISRAVVPRIRVGGARPTDRRLFVVATQTIEVGANLDLDALVTECAPLSALVQRFGRVNRVGERSPRRCAVVHAAFAHDDDVVYGEATANTWAFLAERSPDVLELDRARFSRLKWPSAGGVDFGVRTVRGLLPAPAALEPQSAFTPVLLGAHLERWAATSPAPFPDQPVAPFLHGVGRGAPEVAVAWRAAPPGDWQDADRWKPWLDLAPPVEWEYVSVPIWEVRALLAAEAADTPLADLESALTPDRGQAEEGRTTELLGVVYRGGRETVTGVTGPEDVAVGDRLILDCDVGGHDRWGWTGTRAGPDEPPVPDVGDLAPTRSRRLLRLAPTVLLAWARTPDDRQAIHEAFREMGRDVEIDRGVLSGVVAALRACRLPAALKDHLDHVDVDSWNAHRVALTEEERSGMEGDGSEVVIVLSEPSSRGVLAGAKTRIADDAASDDDTASTSQVGTRITLRQHGADVGELAARFARNLGLSEDLVEAITLAGRWHDLGKADRRFQVMLHDGDELEAMAAAAPLAKSGRDLRDPVARRARAVSGLPRGFRHEAVSARVVEELLERSPELAAGTDAELVRHLVVSHHGFGRPLVRPIVDLAAPKIEVIAEGVDIAVDGVQRQVDWTQPQRFERLCSRYGWWGVALLETLVRLADIRCSEEAGS